MDTSLPEESIPEVIAKQSVSAVNIFVMDQCDQTSLEDKETDAFLDEVHKKKISDEIRQRNREKKLQAQESLPISPEEKRPQVLDSITQPCNSISSEVSANSDGEEVPPEEKICSEQDSKCKKGKGVNKLKQELFAPELSTQDSSIEQNYVTEISETLCPGKLTSGNESSIDEASHYLAQLCDKAFDAEDKANRANQEEILCWCLYAKDFIIRLNGIIENSGGKFGEKKARGLLYDSITKQLNLLCKQRSQEMGLQLRDGDNDDDFDKILMEAFEEEEARIEKKRQNKTSTNVETPAKANVHNDDDFNSDSNHPIHDILLREEIARLERISNSPGYYYDLSSGKKTYKNSDHLISAY
ncbi:3160_t:CDS:2 [Racocetra fulgida]|uniref:3160_t:CDS:1 n=1 Tax=Racocetra fulgida TaxID=60492 RepID=A0A9N9HWY8_9GLOM|nr:3160_t:CDS:2 [Racocetra fulgida]